MASQPPSIEFAAFHDIPLDQLLREIQSSVHAPIDGPDYRHPGNDIFVIAEKAIGSRSVNVTTGPLPPENLVEWITEINRSPDLEGHQVRGWWHAFRRIRPAVGETTLMGTSLILSSKVSFDPSRKSEWLQTQTIGFLGGPHDTYINCLQELVDLAFATFRAQPTRLFLHGLLMHGDCLEQWVFDRSGLYCWSEDDVQSHDGRVKLMGVMEGYRYLDDKALGRSDLIRIINGKTFMTGIPDLDLQEEPIFTRDSLTSPGTTCYLARVPPSNSNDHIVKLKWRSASAQREEDYFTQAQNAGVRGVVTLLKHKEYDFTTAKLRQGAFCGDYRKLLLTNPDAEPRGTERSASGILANSELTTRSFVDLTLNCFAMAPTGRDLRTFQNNAEFLIALRDAALAHRSLLQTGRMLQRDISIHNILILDHADGRADAVSGLLLDLDVAKRIDEPPEAPGHRVGVRTNMAIEVLEGELPHSYRHDLESLLYVMLRVLIADEDDNVRDESLLKKWVRGSLRDSAEAKRQQMKPQNFPRLLEEVPERYRGLCPLLEELRGILFPLTGDGSVWTGTDPERTDEIYDAIVEAFESAIRREKHDEAIHEKPLAKV